MREKFFTDALIRTICAGVLLSAPLAPSHAQQAPAIEYLVPLPDPNPLRSPAMTPDGPPAPPHPRRVETPEWSEQDISLAVNKCGMMLAGTGALYKQLKPIREGRCGAPAAVEISGIGNITPVKINPPARVTCALAATLGAWMDFIVQPAAREHLGAQVTQIRNVASYVCRNRYGLAEKPLSEHALANALDMAAFQTDNGAWVTVLDHWALPPDDQAEESAQQRQAPLTKITKSGELTKPAADPVTPVAVIAKPEISSEAVFLNEIHTGACTLFGTVLGPRANDAHKDHYHYDMAVRANGNYCE